jgi:hypothetical protein
LGGTPVWLRWCLVSGRGIGGRAVPVTSQRKGRGEATGKNGKIGVKIERGRSRGFAKVFSATLRVFCCWKLMILFFRFCFEAAGKRCFGGRNTYLCQAVVLTFDDCGCGGSKWLPQRKFPPRQVSHHTRRGSTWLICKTHSWLIKADSSIKYQFFASQNRLIYQAYLHQ